MTAKQACLYRDFAVRDSLGYSESQIRARESNLPPGVRISRDYLGYPELCNLPNGNLLVSTWSGYCFEVNPDSGHLNVQPPFGFNPGCLSSPAATATQPILCSAATRVIWTEVSARRFADFARPHRWSC